ncbi:MAG: Nif3-like dinuclear metal center hexameric protein, partial [Acutalibacteraceae bacterium]|nr:Nif3-like dinuclear metal center hexameric protein [Acutalibacteraceae bacterium]
MAVVGDIYNALDAFCPFDVHEQWDNVGLLVGESSAQVTRAAVVLDITPDAVERAHEAGAQLIISHHPVIFHPIKNLGAHDPVYLLAKYGMNAICAHTNLDCADGGVNDVLAQCLGLENVRKIPSPNAGTMLLRAGELREELSPKQFAELVSQRLCCHVRYCDGGRSIK